MAATLDALVLSAATITTGSTETITCMLRGDASGASGLVVETIVTNPLGGIVLDATNSFQIVAANSANPFTLNLLITASLPRGAYSVTQGIRVAPETITVATPSGVTAGTPVLLRGTYGYALTGSPAPSTFTVS